MPTLVALLEDYLRPEVIERLRPLQNAFVQIMSGSDRVLQNIANAPASPGYEPWLIERGTNRIAARGLAMVLTRAGRRRAKDSQWRLKVVKAIRFLAKPGRRKDAFMRKAVFLLEAWEETAVIETIFRQAGRDEFEFTRLLNSARNGEVAVLFGCLAEIAAALGPFLSVARGPKVSAELEAHEFFLAEIATPTGAAGYAWSDLEDDFIDDQTKATRREFNSPSFDPRPAHGKVNARHRTIAGP